MTKNSPPTPDVIEAAGGLLWRTTPGGDEIAIIHRPKYDDWTLPKGKRKPGESWVDTALREVYEETGCRFEQLEFAGGQAYSVDGIPKVVLYWHMRLLEEGTFIPNEEVDQILWLPVADAVQMMSYEAEKALLERP